MQTAQLSLVEHATSCIKLQIAVEDVAVAMREGRRYLHMQVVVLEIPSLLTEEITADLRRQGISLPKIHGVNVSVLRVPKEQEKIAGEWIFVSVEELEAAKREGRDYIRCAGFQRMIAVPFELARQLLIEAGLLEG